ncbi:MAG: DNA-directed RNA polymerase subunit delta [Bacilli bacterium]|jgi:DNA-directed RNA polymerase delta subunit
MNIKKMSKEELEQLSYTDITYYLLQSKPKTTNELFSEIIKLLELPDSAYEEKIGDYYTALTTDKRFIILKNGKWDLRSRHASDNFIIELDEEDEEDILAEEEEEEDILATEDEEEHFDSIPEEDEEDLVGDDDVFDDLTIIDEDEDEI